MKARVFSAAAVNSFIGQTLSSSLPGRYTPDSSNELLETPNLTTLSRCGGVSNQPLESKSPVGTKQALELK
ncbi:MAG TPA: hypothetical protein PKC13_27805 [Blastocatellia bacterium]|nr:hypothetical protein [Blastocatellia bacterium]HMV83516.1 hypothetical protein [Blastocatellia bacterium]HMX29423.1 hypothetical protein [Blastocatellia bacterium]HMY71366.1 hypothetical protein [Blastocatellia bacterium]